MLRFLIYCVLLLPMTATLMVLAYLGWAMVALPLLAADTDSWIGRTVAGNLLALARVGGVVGLVLVAYISMLIMDNIDQLLAQRSRRARR